MVNTCTRCVFPSPQGGWCWEGVDRVCMVNAGIFRALHMLCGAVGITTTQHALAGVQQQC